MTLASTNTLQKLKVDLDDALIKARKSGASPDQIVAALDACVEPLRPTRRPRE